MAKAQWVIDKNPAETEQKYREEHGDEGYEDRVAVADARANEFPESEWESAMFYRPQFRSMALQASDKIWPQLREKDYKFWTRLFQRMAL